MIDGLKLTVLGRELSALYAANAKDYRNRAEDLRKLASKMADAAQEVIDDEPAEFTHYNTIQSRATASKQDYMKLARERDLTAKKWEFAAAHFLPDERYAVSVADVLALVI